MALAGPVLGPPRSAVPGPARQHERPAAPGLRDVQRADPARERDRFGRHGGVLRQLRPARRPCRGRRQRRVRRADVRGGRPATAPRSSGSTPSGASRSTPTACSRRIPAPAMIAVVHAETSTGVRNDIEPLGRGQGRRAAPGGHGDLARGHRGRRRRLVGRHRLQRHPEVPRRPAGPRAASLSPTRAVERIVERPSSWYLDLNLLARYVNDVSGGARVYHHTAPVTMVAALHAGLGALLDEGLQAAWARHAECGRLLQDGLDGLGLELLVAADHRLPQLTTVRDPGRCRRRRGAARAPRRPTASRSAPARAGWPGRSGGSAAWGTPHAGATSSPCWAR